VLHAAPPPPGLEAVKAPARRAHASSELSSSDDSPPASPMFLPIRTPAAADPEESRIDQSVPSAAAPPLLSQMSPVSPADVPPPLSGGQPSDEALASANSSPGESEIEAARAAQELDTSCVGTDDAESLTDEPASVVPTDGDDTFEPPEAAVASSPTVVPPPTFARHPSPVYAVVLPPPPDGLPLAEDRPAVPLPLDVSASAQQPSMNGWAPPFHKEDGEPLEAEAPRVIVPPPTWARHPNPVYFVVLPPHPAVTAVDGGGTLQETAAAPKLPHAPPPSPRTPSPERVRPPSPTPSGPSCDDASGGRNPGAPVELVCRLRGA